MRHFARTVVVTLALGIAPWVAACRSPEAPHLRVGTNVWIGYEPLHAWKERGGRARSLELVEYVSATQVLRAFENREIDAAALTLDECLRLEAATHDVRLVAVTDYSHGGDALVAGGGRASLSQLEGARVGVEHTALGALMLTRALELGHLGAAQVTIVPLTVNEHERAWDAGVVDAVVTFEPVVSRLVAQGGRVLLSSVELHGEVVDVLVIRRSLERQDSLTETLRAEWFAARDWAVADHQAFAKLAAPRLGVGVAAVESLVNGIEFPSREESERAVGGGLRSTALKLAGLMRDRQLGAVEDADVAALFAEQR